MNWTDNNMEGGTCKYVDKLRVPGGGAAGGVGIFLAAAMPASKHQIESAHMCKMSTLFSVLTSLDKLCCRLCNADALKVNLHD